MPVRASWPALLAVAAPSDLSSVPVMAVLAGRMASSSTAARSVAVNVAVFETAAVLA